MLKESEIGKFISEDFSDDFPNGRYIIDGTHLAMQTPANFLLQRIMYSSYKRMVSSQVVLGILKQRVLLVNIFEHLINTYLFITVIAPNGLFMCRSSLYGGLSAEVTTILDNSILPKLLKGDIW